MEQAACRGKGPDVFFPERGESQKPGKAICAPCPVKDDCEEYRRRTGSTHGMWGGKMVKRSGRE